MKYPCGLVKDIMPLYHDEVCSGESRNIVEEHFEECPDCKEYYNRICESDALENIVYDEQKETQRAQSIKSARKAMKKRNVVLIAVACVATVIIMWIVTVLLAMLIMAFSGATARIEENTDISRYDSYIGENAEEKYRDKWGMNEEIFPNKISDGMTVRDYKSVYYNPWDAQYLTLLVVDYEDAQLEGELERLEGFDSTEYIGYYGVTGFDGEYRVVAMYADRYQGFVYALTDDKGTVVYVEMIFCNYFMDLDYSKYIPEEYLPDGFDATSDNPYRQQLLQEKSE